MKDVVAFPASVLASRQPSLQAVDAKHVYTSVCTVDGHNFAHL